MVQSKSFSAVLAESSETRVRDLYTCTVCVPVMSTACPSARKAMMALFSKALHNSMSTGAAFTLQFVSICDSKMEESLTLKHKS